MQFGWGMEPDSRRSLILWLAAIIFLASLGKMARTIQDAPAIDFYHYWVVGQAVRRDGIGDIYSPAGRERLGELFWQRAQHPGIGDAQRAAAEKFRHLETTSTPFLYASLAPFLGGNYDRDRIAYNALCSVAFVASVWLLCRRLRYGSLPTVLALLFVTVGFEPTYFDVRVGNVNRLEFVLLAAFLLLPSEDSLQIVLRGVVLGLAGMFKPNLVFPICALFVLRLITRDLRRVGLECCGLALGGATAFFAASRFFGGPSIWLEWLEAAGNLTRDFSLSPSEGNLALAPLLAVWGGPLGERIFTGSAIAMVAGPFAYAAAQRRRLCPNPTPEARFAGDLLTIGIACAASILASPLAWVHYFVLALFLVLSALSPRVGELSRLRSSFTLGCIAATAMGPVLNPLLVSEPRAWAILGNLGLAGLVALALIDLRDGSQCAQECVAPRS
jgi:hypothetical protein